MTSKTTVPLNLDVSEMEDVPDEIMEIPDDFGYTPYEIPLTTEDMAQYETQILGSSAFSINFEEYKRMYLDPTQEMANKVYFYTPHVEKTYRVIAEPPRKIYNEEEEEEIRQQAEKLEKYYTLKRLKKKSVKKAASSNKWVSFKSNTLRHKDTFFLLNKDENATAKHENQVKQENESKTEPQQQQQQQQSPQQTLQEVPQQEDIQQPQRNYGLITPLTQSQKQAIRNEQDSHLDQDSSQQPKQSPRQNSTALTPRMPAQKEPRSDQNAPPQQQHQCDSSVASPRLSEEQISTHSITQSTKRSAQRTTIRKPVDPSSTGDSAVSSPLISCGGLKSSSPQTDNIEPLSSSASRGNGWTGFVKSRPSNKSSSSMNLRNSPLVLSSSRSSANIITLGSSSSTRSSLSPSSSSSSSSSSNEPVPIAKTGYSTSWKAYHGKGNKDSYIGSGK